MKRVGRRSLTLAVFVSIVAGFLGFPGAIYAQDASLMSCNELWYARNQIYAAEGYCFSTARAQSIFGMGCFPPYGKLNPEEKQRVNLFQTWESRRGCPL